MDSSAKAANFNIESGYFFTSSTEPEIFCGCLSVSWLCPVVASDVSAGIAQKVKLAKEAIFGNILPCNLRSWWSQGCGLGVVVIDRIADSI
jgi:hypothetical protein